MLNGDNDNVDAAKLCQAYPDKFFGVPTVDLFFGKQENLRIIDDYIVNGPCRALMVEPGFSEQPMYYNSQPLHNLSSLVSASNTNPVQPTHFCD